MSDWLAERFEEQRPRLRAVAYRVLGSVSDAEDAVQETWLRASRAETDLVANLAGWLTTIVARVSLNMLASRSSRREDLIDTRLPDPVLSAAHDHAHDDAHDDPEQRAIVVDSVSLALLMVLETLAPTERLAFVLHDVFGMPFDDIAPIVDRSPAATRQLASRARRRVRGAAPTPEADPRRQRAVVDAFFEASSTGDLDALVAVLHPDIVLRADAGDGAAVVVRGSREAARTAAEYARLARFARPVLVNGSPGFVVIRDAQPVAVLGFIVADGKIHEIDVLADPVRLSRLDLSML